MSWFDHLLLTESPCSGAFAGKKCLVLTRTGLERGATAALARKLRCDFSVLRPSGSARDLGPSFKHVRGTCWSVKVPRYHWCADRDDDFLSPVRVFEDGQPLISPRSPFERIAGQGRGAYRHWKGRLLFSTSDNSDPCRNGRTYHLEVAPLPPGDHTLELDYDHRGRLLFGATLIRKMKRLKPEIFLLAEPPDGNLFRIIKAARCCGSGSIVLPANTGWMEIPLNRATVLRPSLIASLVRKTARRQAAGIKAVLTQAFRRHGAWLPDQIFHTLYSVIWALLRAARQVSRWGSWGSVSRTSNLNPVRAGFKDDIEQDNRNRSGAWLPDRQPLRIVQYISQLGPGGAERQICNLSGKLKEQGHRVKVLTTFPLQGSSAHYRSLLEEMEVDCFQAGTDDPSGLLETALSDQTLKKHLLPFVPPQLAGPVRNLLADLIQTSPQIIHCWLDWSNILGGLAGFLAGTPLIILSTRNLNPTHFPRFYRPWQKEWYRFLSRSKRVRFIANSRAGADDYASWLDLPPDSFKVIRNGIAPKAISPPLPGEALRFRDKLGLKTGDLLVGGVFRLDPEKRPRDFLKVIKAIRVQSDRVKAVMAGEGTLSNKIAADIRRMGLGNVVFPLGRRSDVGRIMAACRVILLTSRYEGTPNVLIEAQGLGLPVVAARAGGVPETVLDGESGFLHEVGEIDGMAQSVIRLLGDPALCSEFGRAGKRFVENEFDLEKSTQTTLDFYRECFKNRS